MAEIEAAFAIVGVTLLVLILGLYLIERFVACHGWHRNVQEALNCRDCSYGRKKRKL